MMLQLYSGPPVASTYCGPLTCRCVRRSSQSGGRKKNIIHKMLGRTRPRQKPHDKKRRPLATWKPRRVHSPPPCANTPLPNPHIPRAIVDCENFFLSLSRNRHVLIGSSAVSSENHFTRLDRLRHAKALLFQYNPPQTRQGCRLSPRPARKRRDRDFEETLVAAYDKNFLSLGSPTARPECLPG
ncbi:uncharacterized protein B0I36DRAFT_143023 [Microdochium trichocladiopsis]|uniref:Uncharacterized protein n=1 Tax=Microdochium trichocladiopsis TaxID=1682393 RepID=A0A9P9BL63_9PEZI|nr:uncharacterized protein B0I36DRAFT_143023 [Microdochium trichocladiopsis]KAH7027757.1 hypothetical protein B0I36DRAFT_143023 [Microdochium trichocladiopsis]